MDRIKRIHQVKRHLVDVLDLEHDRIEKLRLILESEQNRNVSFEEAHEIGRDLIGLYECLAGNKKITREGLDDLLGAVK